MAARTPVPRAPATRDQADAYRFGLRRWEAALVRGDPVPMHEQLRTQRRAAVAGLLLGMLALAAVTLYGLVVPAPDWRAHPVVVGASSGAVYAVVGRPEVLVPVANPVAARLVLAAAGDDRVGADAAPVLVADRDLDSAPRTATAAVPGAVAVAPGATPAARWAVCDVTTAGGSRTVVVGGSAVPGGGSEAAWVRVDGGTWLLAGGVRHRVDPLDAPVLTAFGLAGVQPRDASPALVGAVPEGPPLTTPVPARVGREPAAGDVGRVGDVLVAPPVADRAPARFAVLDGGVQEVPAPLAAVLVAAGGAELAVDSATIAAAPRVPPGAGGLDVAGWPAAVPAVRSGPAGSVCWEWDATGPGGEGAPATAVVLTDVVPGTDPVVAAAGAAAGRDAVAPPGPGPSGVDGARGAGAGVGAPGLDLGRAVALAAADGAGPGLDAVLLTPGSGGAVRAAGPGRQVGTGPLWLVSATGVAYGVADDATATALGIPAAAPAPETLLRLLPTGPTLDVAEAGRAVDVLVS